jgi:TPR repeat protein
MPEQAREDSLLEIGTQRNAVRLTPDRPDLRLSLAQGLYRIGDLDAAVDECRAAIALNPGDAKAHAQLGVLLMARQDWKSAAVSLQDAVRLDPELTQAHYNLGSVHYALGNVMAAMQSYREAIAMQPHFPDARYHLALLLRLTNHEREAAQLMEEAAIGGVPQAQYFLANSYQQGLGVEKNLAQAIAWWAKAAALGHQQAADVLSKLRRHAFAAEQSERRRQEIADAFRRYRHELWADYPNLTPPHSDESLGITLLYNNQPADGLAVLLAEAYALSAPAHAELARLYENGNELGLAHYDRRILACFDMTAAEGFLPAKKTLARIYAKGLGVETDRTKARIILKGLPKQDVQTLIDELGLR